MTNALPTRGEVWLVRLPSGRGVELQRDRPAVVISSPAFAAAPLRIVAPLTTWRSEFNDRINKIHIAASERNGLEVDSAADFLQVRSVSSDRFLRLIGSLENELVEEIVAGVVIALDYES